MKYLRSLAYQRGDGSGVCELTVIVDDVKRTMVIEFDSGHQALDYAERVRAMGNAMLINEPRRVT